MTEQRDWLRAARERCEAATEPVSPFNPQAAWDRRDMILACVTTDLPLALRLLAEAAADAEAG